MKDGLYRITTNYLCAHFVVENSQIVDIAPILKNKINYWMSKAIWIGK